MHLFLLTLCAFATLCAGATLRHQTKSKSALEKMQERYAAGKNTKTAWNGKQFTSILDHPSTTAFFQGKDEAEISDMVDSVVFAHMVGHSPLKAKTARSNEELRGASFVQLASSHGIDFKTLQALHKKSGKGHLDMEVWWREQALHASVHVEHGGEASMEHLERDTKNPFEATFMETFKAQRSKKNRATKVAMNAKTSKTATMVVGAAAATKSTAEVTTKTHRATKVAMNIKTSKAVKTVATAATAAAKSTAARQLKATGPLVANENSKTRTKTPTTSFVSLKTRQKLGDSNYGDFAWSSCDDGSRLYDCPGPLNRCVGHVDSKGGGEECYANDSCESDTCAGNNGVVCVGDGGRCLYVDGTILGEEDCSKNSECISGTCIGNGGGTLVHFGSTGAGKCDFPNQSRNGEESCNKDDNCVSGTCIGNGGGVLGSIANDQMWAAGKCDFGDHSRNGEESCNKNDNCVSGTCIGNGGGVLGSIANDQMWAAGKCDFADNSRDGEETCNKNDNCVSGTCVGNGGGVLSSIANEAMWAAGQCDFVDRTRGGTCSCNDDAALEAYHLEWSNVCQYYQDHVFPHTACAQYFGGMTTCMGFCNSNQHKSQFQDRWQSGSGGDPFTFDLSLGSFSFTVDCNVNIPPHPAPFGFATYSPNRAQEATDPLITKSHCEDTLGCDFTHHYQSCNHNINCKSVQCNGNVWGLGGSFSFGVGQCAAEAASLLPWEVCATHEECLSGHCEFDGLAHIQLHSRGHCTLDHSRKARYNCRCKRDEECLSGTCAGDLFSDNDRCTAEVGTMLAGDPCRRNGECESGTCEGNNFGASEGHCAGPFARLRSGAAGTSDVNTLATDGALTERVRPGQVVKVTAQDTSPCSVAGDYASPGAIVGANVITLSDSLPHLMAAADSCKVTYFQKAGLHEACRHNSFCESNCCKGNLIGLTEGTCSATAACLSGLVREAGRWIADVVKSGLRFLAEGLIKVLQWILAAAEGIFNQVSSTNAGFLAQMQTVKELTIEYDNLCPRATEPPHDRPTTSSCLEKSEELAAALAEADKMKQMNQFKLAAGKATETSCEPNADGSAVTGENCSPRVSAVTNALGAWAPQYWADTAGVGFKYFSGDIHKIYDFQTLEYGYASDLGVDVDADLAMAVLQTQNDVASTARNVQLLSTAIQGWTDVSATVSANVGWKGRNRGNWKNLNDGYTGDAFGVGASLPLKPLDAGVFSIDGGIQVGIQSDFKCSFIDRALNFVGNTPAALADGACGTHTLSAAEIANDIVNKMFVWKGTKMIGVSLSASYDPPDPPDPNLTPTQQAAAAAEALAAEGIGLEVGAGISSTKLFKQYGGCFGSAPRTDGAPHSDSEQVEALVKMLGFMWMGEDEELQGANATPWYERLFTILAHLTASSQMLPLRIMQTVMAVVQHITTRQEMPGNCGCMWCRASNLGECIPCTAGQEALDTNTCRMRHWCKATGNQGQCFANDYTGNFFMERLTHPDIVDAQTCAGSCAEGSSCTYIRPGKCVLSNKCVAIAPASWGHLNDAAAQLTAAQSACTAASECSWHTALSVCVLAAQAIATNEEWVGLEAETHSLFLADGVTTTVETSVCQQSVAQRTTTTMVEAVPQQCVQSVAERTTPAVMVEQDTNECLTYHPTQCVGGSPARPGRAAQYSHWSKRRRRFTGYGLSRHAVAAVPAVPCTTTGGGCATYRTEMVEQTPAVVAPCQNFVMVPQTVVAPCQNFVTTDRPGLVWDQAQCESANLDTNNPTHKWAHNMMFPTQIRHDNVYGAASNGVDATSTPNNVRPADTPPLPVLTQVAGEAAGDLSASEETNNEGALKQKIDHALIKIGGLNPDTNPDAASLLTVIDQALVRTQEKLNEISESGTNLVVHRGVEDEDEEEECYEASHTWPWRL